MTMSARTIDPPHICSLILVIDTTYGTLTMDTALPPIIRGPTSKIKVKAELFIHAWTSAR